MTMKDGEIVELPTGDDTIDGMEGRRTKGKLYETTELKWKMEQYIGVRKHRARGEYTKETQTIGDIPRTMKKEEAKRICSQMDTIRKLIDEKHDVRKCEICKTKGNEEMEIVPSQDNADLCKDCRQKNHGSRERKLL